MSIAEFPMFETASFNETVFGKISRDFFVSNLKSGIRGYILNGFFIFIFSYKKVSPKFTEVVIPPKS